MSLAYAILVSLADCPKSGYDLAKSFDGSVGFFWKATHQQIYRELTKLEDQGWIVAELIPQDNRPDKKLFSLTLTGMQELQDWLAQPCEPAPVKEELLVKVFVGHLIQPEILEQELKRHRQEHIDKLEIYRGLEQNHFSAPDSVGQKSKFQYLTLLRGIGYETDWIAWCDQAIAMLSTKSEA